VRGIAAVRWRTSRLALRAFEEGDEAEFVRVLEVSKERWTPWVPARPEDWSPRDQFRRELHRSAAGAAEGTHLRLGAFLDDGRLAGLFSLNEIVRGVFQNAYAGWSVSGDLIGQGLGTEGVRALLEIAFTPFPAGLGLHRVQANIMPANAPSLRIAEKVGFRREGIAIRYLQIAGVWEDHVTFAVTAEEHEPSSRSPSTAGEPGSSSRSPSTAEERGPSSRSLP